MGFVRATPEIAARGDAKTLLLGMNLGPWGMAQSGIPFGATDMAKKIGIKSKPLGEAKHHPKRPLIGLDLERQEVSGTRIWNILSKIMEMLQQSLITYFWSTIAHFFVVKLEQISLQINYLLQKLRLCLRHAMSICSILSESKESLE